MAEVGANLLSYHLDQDPFRASSVKLTVEDLLPRSKIEPAVGDEGFSRRATHARRLQDIESDTGYDARRRRPPLFSSTSV